MTTSPTAVNATASSTIYDAYKLVQFDRDVVKLFIKYISPNDFKTIYPQSRQSSYEITFERKQSMRILRLTES